MKKYGARIILLIGTQLVFFVAYSQMITGVWHGKINRQKVEVKIVLNGDSLTGTSYYYENAGNFRRYSIKGYFDEISNQVTWWDDQLLEEKSGRFNISTPGKMPLLSRADFNCPGDGSMMLDGKASRLEDGSEIRAEVHLDKKGPTQFEDEWDYVIENYTVGANDPEIIDSVALIAGRIPENTPRVIADDPVPSTGTVHIPLQKPASSPETKVAQPVAQPAPVIEQTVALKPATIDEKFLTRKKEFTKEIPLSGDSVELRFYDNAEIDGDSISLFLNDKLIYQNIRLTGNAWIIRLAIAELNDSNELIMVAENMGSIPPNTSYMVAIVENKRYDAYLASTEGSSAMVRFVKANENK